jgi:hypothetical protein
MSGISRKHGVVPKSFSGALNNSPLPQKKPIFFQRTQNFSRKRVGASQIGDYKKKN